MIKRFIQWRAKRNEKYYIKRIEKALGFELFNWQKEYILGKSSNVPSARNTGKTTAVFVKFILDYESDPVDFRRRNIADVKRDLKDDNDIEKITNRWLIEQMREYYMLLEKSGLKLRKIYFPFTV